MILHYHKQAFDPFHEPRPVIKNRCWAGCF